MRADGIYATAVCLMVTSGLTFLILLIVALAQNNDTSQVVASVLGTNGTNSTDLDNLADLVIDVVDGVGDALSAYRLNVSDALDCEALQVKSLTGIDCPDAVSGVAVATIVLGVLWALMVVVLVLARPRPKPVRKYYPHRKDDPYPDL